MLAAAVLTACGGGDGTRPVASLPPPLQPPRVDEIVPSASVAAQCQAPRSGIDPDTGAAFADRPGSLDTEKRWVRSWIDETYLWYSEVSRNFRARDYATPVAYFDVLKTSATTASGRAKDRFHFTYNTADYRALAQQGVSLGYGFEYAMLSAFPPRDLRVAYTEPGSPATVAGVARGDRLIEIDGVDVTNGSDVATLNAGLLPAREGEAHVFKLRAPNGSERSVTLGAARIQRQSVQNTRSLATATGPVGYLLFNDHLATAESQLISAVTQLKADGVTDLVLDLRYNGGGLLDVASELAFMIASPAATTGTVFERLQFNSKNPFRVTEQQATLPFHATTLGFSVTAGQPLPQLGLSRVTVLTGPDTCSASESIVNSLRGVGVTVNLVGGATCGKPYGFFPEDNCGTTYFAIQFQGVNQQGFGDYGDGFAPTCTVPDDFDHALGDVAESRLAAALELRSTGACPAGTSSKTEVARLKTEAAGSPYLAVSPARANRLVTRPADGR